MKPGEPEARKPDDPTLAGIPRRKPARRPLPEALHTIVRRLAMDLIRDRIHGGYPAQRFVRDLGLPGGMDIKELPPCVCPTEGGECQASCRRSP